MNGWKQDSPERIASSDDLHIAPFREDGVTLPAAPNLIIIGQEGSTQREGGSPSEVPKFQVVTPNLIAFDKSSGKRVGEVALTHNATAAPMTYMHKGKQYIFVATGGANFPAELIAHSL